MTVCILVCYPHFPVIWQFVFHLLQCTLHFHLFGSIQLNFASWVIQVPTKWKSWVLPTYFYNKNWESNGLWMWAVVILTTEVHNELYEVLKQKTSTTKQTQLHASVISLSNSHFLYLPLDWHCCQALMEEGKSNSFKITHCCLLCDLFPVDGSIYLGDKENTEACEVYLLDRSELTETFSSSFSPSPHSQSAFCFYKVFHVFFFEI